MHCSSPTPVTSLWLATALETKMMKMMVMVTKIWLPGRQNTSPGGYYGYQVITMVTAVTRHLVVAVVTSCIG